MLFRPNGIHLTVFYFQVVVIAKKHLRLGGESGCLQGKVRPSSACVRGSAVVGADLQFRILCVAYGVQVLGGGVHGQCAKKSILATGFRTKLNRGLPVFALIPGNHGPQPSKVVLLRSKQGKHLFLSAANGERQPVGAAEGRNGKSPTTGLGSNQVLFSKPGPSGVVGAVVPQFSVPGPNHMQPAAVVQCGHSALRRSVVVPAVAFQKRQDRGGGPAGSAVGRFGVQNARAVR